MSESEREIKNFNQFALGLLGGGAYKLAASIKKDKRNKKLYPPGRLLSSWERGAKKLHLLTPENYADDRKSFLDRLQTPFPTRQIPETILAISKSFLPIVELDQQSKIKPGAVKERERYLEQFRRYQGGMTAIASMLEWIDTPDDLFFYSMKKKVSDWHHMAGGSSHAYKPLREQLVEINKSLQKRIKRFTVWNEKIAGDENFRKEFVSFAVPCQLFLLVVRESSILLGHTPKKKDIVEFCGTLLSIVKCRNKTSGEIETPEESFVRNCQLLDKYYQIAILRLTPQ